MQSCPGLEILRLLAHRPFFFVSKNRFKSMTWQSVNEDLQFLMKIIKAVINWSAGLLTYTCVYNMCWKEKYDWFMLVNDVFRSFTVVTANCTLAGIIVEVFLSYGTHHRFPNMLNPKRVHSEFESLFILMPDMPFYVLSHWITKESKRPSVSLVSLILKSSYMMISHQGQAPKVPNYFQNVKACKYEVCRLS